jgi:hypothetical protein
MAHAKTMLGRKDQSLANVVAVLEGESCFPSGALANSRLCAQYRR